jgi:hypothetical protein
VEESDEVLRRIERRSLLICAVVAVAAAVATRRLDTALGVAGGGALVAISYRGIKAGITAAATPGTGRRAVAIGLVKFFTRYGILAAAAYVIMARLRLPPVAVVAGASSLVIAVMFEALRGPTHPRQS